MSLAKVELPRANVVVSDRCEVAERFMTRFRGLMGRESLPEGGGMFFPRCSSIHMFFMRFPIDVVFLKRGRVTSVHRSVRPWRPFPLTDLRASDTLELPAGTIDRCGIQAGDELCIS